MSVASPSIASVRARPSWTLAALASGSAALVYLNSLRNPFVYDDHTVVVGNDSLKTMPDLTGVVAHAVTRPLVNLSYAVDWSIWGLNPFGFHLTSVLLHMVNVMLAFML